MGFFSMMDDLCRRLASDLDGAFPELVAHLADDVTSGLWRLHGQDAEDLTQETFIRAYRALKAYPSERIENLRLRGWIWTIALNLGRNHARDRARRPRLVAMEDRPSAPEPEPVDGEAWNRRLGRLPAAQRKAVVLRYVVGLSYAEIAEALDRPEGTVKADVHRGLARLRTIMEEEG